MGSLKRGPIIMAISLLLTNPAMAEDKKATPEQTYPAEASKKASSGKPPKANPPKRTDTQKAAQKETDAVTEEAVSAETTGPLPEELADPIAPLTENTLEMCQDGEDNDADSHVDCDDQDCEIFAICVQQPESEPPPAPLTIRVPVHFPVTEIGYQCRDGVDNNENGKIDCHDPSCHSTHHCRRMMYERPEPPDKAPGLLISAAIGSALPNYRLPSAEARWQDPETGKIYEIPFDPDIGVMLDLQVGYLFMKWLGAGVGFKSAFTFASNRNLYFLSKDDENDYKYVGSKYYGNLSAYLRVQYPIARVVPHLGIHVGYSVTQHTWHVYEEDNYWSDIDDYESEDSNDIVGERTEIRSNRERHFTLAFEPGIDVFLVKRLFAIGMKAWLPVVASKHPEGDNVGILLNFIFTPLWREPLQLKPTYTN